jgi:hypothetical protein
MKSSKSRPNIPDPADIFIQTTETVVTGVERMSRKEPLLSPGSSMRRVRSAVKRSRAGEHLFLLLLSFAGSFLVIPGSFLSPRSSLVSAWGCL